MDIQGILERFSLISGLTNEEALIWVPLLTDAKNEIEAKLKEAGATVELK